jgi:tRNA-uridine 2-sulfurtransferase
MSVTNQTKIKVLVAMSGGVDSSVVAYLLKKQGYDVIGVHMLLWDHVGECETNRTDGCCSPLDAADARLVANSLGIPFYIFNYEDTFQEKVVQNFINRYLAGQTPNPCALCNTFLKFDLLLDRATKLGCDFIATGHYIQNIPDADGIFHLYQGVDTNKDQSYFLYTLQQPILSKLLFPLGGFTKLEVRALANEAGLLTAKKKESMEICFVPNKDYGAFIEKHANPASIICGNIIHKNGHLFGKHQGIHLFTVGQRKGLRIAHPTPLYVLSVDPLTGNVVVGEEQDLYKNQAIFHNSTWVNPKPPTGPVQVKIRYKTQPVPAVLEKLENGYFKLLFDTPQRAVTPGQVAAIYHNNELLGGGHLA